MKRILGAFLSGLLVFFPPSVWGQDRGPEQEMIIQLSGISALCSIKGQGLWLQMNDPNSTVEIQRAFAKAKQCTDPGRDQGKAHYQAAIRAEPSSRIILRPVYAAWLDYMAALENPLDRRKLGEARARYERATNELNAELDSRI